MLSQGSARFNVLCWTIQVTPCDTVGSTVLRFFLAENPCTDFTASEARPNLVMIPVDQPTDRNQD